MITTPEIIKKYGQPNESGTYLVTLKLPYPMRLAWDKSVKVTKIRCHKAVASALGYVLQDIYLEYGYDKIVSLGIDLYGGCFNYRKMRGGSDWSRHSWGIAIDLDPERNLLHETSKTARFARPEYKKMIDCFYRYGFVSGLFRNVK